MYVKEEVSPARSSILGLRYVDPFSTRRWILLKYHTLPAMEALKLRAPTRLKRVGTKHP